MNVGKTAAQSLSPAKAGGAIWNLAARTFKLVKFEHTVFALPFALVSAFLAASGMPEVLPLILITAACVFARTSAMSFNRFADTGFDRANPRTRGREIPSGKLSPGYALAVSLVSGIFFIATCAFLNATVLLLSPLALFILITYSYTKRFTALSHLALGAALAMAPVGAWLALGREFSSVPLLLGAAVMLWTAGFDIIYACQDVDFDRSRKLFSLPAVVGIEPALIVSRLFHGIALGCLLALWLVAGLFGWFYLCVLAVVGALVVWEHSLVKPRDLSKVNVAFFTINGMVSFLFMAGTIIDILVQ